MNLLHDALCVGLPCLCACGLALRHVYESQSNSRGTLEADALGVSLTYAAVIYCYLHVKLRTRIAALIRSLCINIPHRFQAKEFFTCTGISACVVAEYALLVPAVTWTLRLFNENSAVERIQEEPTVALLLQTLALIVLAGMQLQVPHPASLERVMITFGITMVMPVYVAVAGKGIVFTSVVLAKAVLGGPT